MEKHTPTTSDMNDCSNILQLDGNVSINNYVYTSSYDSSPIPVLISSRSSSAASSGIRTCMNKPVRKDNKLIEALNMPIFTVYNMRSLWSKINNLAEDILERSVDISFLSEVWEKKEKLSHQASIEEMLEMKGISYISTPRPGLRRGGGAAIAACPKNFSLVKLHIEIPKCLEVVWGLLRPNKVIGKLRKIILCSFYSPPRSKKNKSLIDHIAMVLNKLKSEHPDAATIIAGDKNSLDENGILSLDPALVQIVRKNTRKDKILSVVFTNLDRFYTEPIIIDPIPVDDPNKGVPSDHNGVLVSPLHNLVDTKKTPKEIKFVRPLPDSSILGYRESIANIDWSLMLGGLSSSEMVDTFQLMTTDLVDIHFPLKKISVSRYDKPWITEELKLLRRQRKRKYRKEGRSPDYLKLKKEFDQKQLAEVDKYRNKIVKEVAEGKRGSTYAAIRKLGNREHEDVDTFDIPEFAEKNYDDEECAEALASYFSTISQEFRPIEVSQFPPNLKIELKNGIDDPDAPVLEELEVYNKIVQAKKPHSMVPGDIKRKLVVECSVELAAPVTQIYNKITSSRKFPQPWTREQQTPIPKTHPPSSIEDVRNISGTPFFSKQYESFVSDWLLPIVDPFLDPGQCGGLKKSSISHYLIKLLHYVHYNLDRPQPHSVLLACVDMSKAFNRMSHQKVIEDLFDMKVPGWLLLILISYLTDRKMILKFRGAFSSVRSLPGSSPQGTVLGVILFIIFFNGAALRPNIPRPIWPFFSPRNNDPTEVKMKFIDDLSIAAKVSLKDDLIVDNIERPKPLAYDERMETKLKDTSNALQLVLNQVEEFAENKQMKINAKKTTVMKFCMSKTKSFPVEIEVDGNFLEVKKEIKILGVIVKTNLKWDSNTEFICKKAYKKIWILRRMKCLGLDTFTLVEYYTKEVRVQLELAVPVWHSGITQKQSADIERVQRVAVCIMLGQTEFDYSQACSYLGLPPLSVRRLEICRRFAVKTSSALSRHTDMFQSNWTNTRSKHKYREFKCQNARFYNSSLPFLTRLLNQVK